MKLHKSFAITMLACLVAACSSTKVPEINKATSKKDSPVSKYVERTVVPSNTIASSSNLCVDNFNFLREAGSDSYQSYSKDYIKIGNGYSFLSQNKNIMGNDARQVYNMNLDVKLDTLCNKVSYAGFSLIKNKVKELDGI